MAQRAHHRATGNKKIRKKRIGLCRGRELERIVKLGKHDRKCCSRKGNETKATGREHTTGLGVPSIQNERVEVQTLLGSIRGHSNNRGRLRRHGGECVSCSREEGNGEDNVSKR